MSNYWSISIGINQYHHFQPLMQAQNDALALHRFLLDEVGFDDAQSVLLSDLSMSTRHEAVYPDQRAILEWLQVICQQKLAPDDQLWVFFSGYGAQSEGEDYLMPVDGDPANVAKTGLKLRDVIDLLQQAPTQNQLLILDMNRSQSALAGQQIGAQTLELAKAAGLPLLLSCQPDEFSHETLAVRHGLFTAALLEGLRYHGCFTLAHISDYLKTRLPELCEHHWRPVQNPVAVIPEDKKFMVVLPQSALENLQLSPSGSRSTGGAIEGAMGGLATIEDVDILAADVPVGNVAVHGMDGFQETGSDADTVVTPELDLTLPESYTTEPDPTTTVEPPEDPVRSGSGGSLTAWGLLVALLLLGGVAVRNLPFLQAAVSNLSLPEWATFDGSPNEASPDRDGDDESTVPPAAEENRSDGNDTDGNAAEGNESTETESNDTAPEPPNEEDGAAPVDEVNEEANETENEETPVDPDQGRPVDDPDAGDAISETPISDPSELIAASANSNNGGGANRQTNRALLESARQSIEPNQASRFVEAIEIARQIQPGDAFYEDAQADINRWSRVILDMAEGRAASGNLEGAIAAAQLVPADQQTVSQQAQQRIAFWQQRQRSRAIIQEAQNLPRTGQASTYQSAIFLLQQVPAGQAEYAAAQGLIDEWSQKMLSIAQARAAQGRNNEAIQAARLIPKGTAAYEQAQRDIQRWE
ncbi:MAG: caspase family protein [Cyanobacteria bacterium J06632_22]